MGRSYKLHVCLLSCFIKFFCFYMWDSSAVFGLSNHQEYTIMATVDHLPHKNIFVRIQNQGDKMGRWVVCQLIFKECVLCFLLQHWGRWSCQILPNEVRILLYVYSHMQRQKLVAHSWFLNVARITKLQLSEKQKLLHFICVIFWSSRSFCSNLRIPGRSY